MAHTFQNILRTAKLRRYLRSRTTGQYYTGRGWSPDWRRAKRFTCEIDAVRAFLQNGLYDIELVVRFPGSGNDLVSIPLE
jgi:hypothetical protein